MYAAVDRHASCGVCHVTMLGLRQTAKRVGGANWSVLFNAGTLASTNVLTLGLGFVYWWLAARWFSPSAIGLASAAIAAMSLLGSFAMLGLGSLLIGELPRRPGQRGQLIVTAMVAAGIAGFALGAGFAALAPHFSLSLRPLGDSVWKVLLFALGVALTALSVVLDQAFIGLLRGSLQLWRNGLFSVAKLLALALAGMWLVNGGGGALYATWVVGYVVCLALVLPLVGGTRHLHRPRPSLLRGLGWQAVGHHVLNVTMQLAGLAMPLIVTVILSTTANAYYYTASMVGSLVFIVPSSLATVFFAVGAAEPATLVQRFRFSLGLSVLLTTLAIALMSVAAGPVMGVFGHSYSENGTIPLELFAAVNLPLCVREHYAAIQRVYGRPAGAAPLVLLGSVLKLVMGAKGATLDGLVGLGVGLLIASCIEAAVMAPTVGLALRTAAPSTA